jgi:hypothetical protein
MEKMNTNKQRRSLSWEKHATQIIHASVAVACTTDSTERGSHM